MLDRVGARYGERVSLAAPGLARGWPSFDLPGYREHPTLTTYSVFDQGLLPPIERQLDDGLAWLLAEPPVEHSLAGGHIYEGEPMTAATAVRLDALIADLDVTPPPAFEKFIRVPELRSRVRSCTACYLDLASFPVHVDRGGWLLHFLSDQQWVRHWLLYVDRDGAEAVVSTDLPYGFGLESPEDEPGWTSDQFNRGSGESIVCADSFSEFLYRFWIENEIWFALAEHRGLTHEQRRYAEHYLRGGPLSRTR